MTRATILVCSFLLLSGTIVAAERDLVPTLDNQPDVCPDQPSEPEWMRNTEARDAYKRLLVQQIYRFQSMGRIVDAQGCACATRYPSWEAAEAVYFDRYSSADYWDVVEATSDYRRRANDLRKQAMPICEAAGNWQRVMSVVAYFVETAEGYLDSAAETQFGAVAATVGTMLVLGTTLVVILVCLNMIYQYRSMDGRTAFWLAVKIGLIGIFATNWVQFNALASAILNGIDSIAGSLVASVGGGTPGPSGTFAEEFDQLIAALGDYLNAAGSELNWMAGALLDTLGVLLLSILGGLAAFIVVASRLMITLLIGIAPVMIFLTLFEVTKDYFARWLSALISFAIYPIVIAGVFATITGVSRALLAELGDPEGASNIGALLPFFMMVLMAKGFIIATPFIVRSVSGNIMMPALSAGFGGSYAFARGLAGSQQVYNRYAIGGATGAEYAALRARQFLGVQALPTRPNAAGGAPAAPSGGSSGTGARMLAQLARLSRLGRRQRCPEVVRLAGTGCSRAEPLLSAGFMTNSMNGFALVASCRVWGRTTAMGSGGTASAPLLLPGRPILYPLLRTKRVIASFPREFAGSGQQIAAMFSLNI